MKIKLLFVLGISFLLIGPAYALYSVSNRGEWPTDWPAELEKLRVVSKTLVGPMVENQHYAIPFKNRDEFELAWPFILKVKSDRTPIILTRGSNFFLGNENIAGVIIHAPPRGEPDTPIPYENLSSGYGNRPEHWLGSTYIELVTDGEIVDLNRIALPDNSLLFDKRFDKDKQADTPKKSK